MSSERNGATEYDAPPSGGGLGMFLAVMVGLLFLAFLYVISPDMVIAALVLLLLPVVHWFLWGKRMTKETEAERQQLLEEDAAEERRHTEKPQHPPWERRF
jgi:hypothetical protein